MYLGEWYYIDALDIVDRSLFLAGTETVRG